MPYTPDGRFSSWITIDGVELPEYGLQVTLDAKTITCWIPSEAGKKLCVHWKNWSFVGHTRGDVKMDGVDCGGRLSLSFSESDLPQSSFKDGVAEGSLLKPFMFSDLRWGTEDASFAQSSPTFNHLGSIELSIHPVHVLSNDVPCNTSPTLFALKVPDHERNGLEVTQQITLAEPIYNARQTYSSTARLGPDFVTFIFKYRPLHVLKSNGLAGGLGSKGLKRKGKESAYEEPTVVLSEKLNIPGSSTTVSRTVKESRGTLKAEDEGPSEGFGLVPVRQYDSQEWGELTKNGNWAPWG